MTPQSLDAVVALVPVEPTRKMVAAGTFGGILTPNQACASFQAQVLAAPDWHPTPEAINALPQPLRDYIHTIQTSHPSYDNAVKVKRLEEKVAMLERALGEWQPIERAPLDRSVIVSNGEAVGEARYHESDAGWWWAGYYPTDAADGYIWEPTHWRPLPEPPQSEER